MTYVSILFRITGGLCIFLYGMKIMSDGIQQAAVDRMQKALNFMTGNRFVAVLTGIVVTNLVQSSSAVSVMVVSFVNAGLLTVMQSIGVIMGANIGTTFTAWIVSLVGFTVNLSNLAVPAFGIGFLINMSKWKYRNAGIVFMGFSFIFLGLKFISDAMPHLGPESLAFLATISGWGFFSILLGVIASTVVTLLIHSSAATITLIMTLAWSGAIDFPFAASMVLGANIGTTIDAILAAIGAKTAARRTALVHVLFNVAGAVAALLLFRPLIFLVEFLVPGPVSAAGDVAAGAAAAGAAVANHVAMFHTVFNVMCTLIFLPFVRQFAALVTFLIKEKPGEAGRQPYRIEYRATINSTPEFNVMRAENEIREMAGIASSMYAEFSGTLYGIQHISESERTEFIEKVMAEMAEKEDIADEMREELTRFLIECTSRHLGQSSERHVYQMMRIIACIEEMTDDCYAIFFMLERSVKKNMLFAEKEVASLAPYVVLVERFLDFVRENLGRRISGAQADYARSLEEQIDHQRSRLRKLGRKQIEAGEDVKRELLFIDIVRRIEKLGDICYNISEALSQMK
jgi:phosphate:Na+ symporter